MKVLFLPLSYIAFFLIVLVIASAIDTVGLVLVPIFFRAKRIVLSLVLLVSTLGAYLGIVAYWWLASVTPLHISCAMIALVVIVQYSNDSAQYRTAHALALLTGDKMPELQLDQTIAHARAIGHALGFAVASLAHLRGSPAF